MDYKELMGQLQGFLENAPKEELGFLLEESKEEPKPILKKAIPSERLKAIYRQHARNTVENGTAEGSLAYLIERLDNILSLIAKYGNIEQKQALLDKIVQEALQDEGAYNKWVQQFNNDNEQKWCQGEINDTIQ